MKRILLAVLALALALPGAALADAPPPLLDRELFFGNPEIAAAQTAKELDPASVAAPMPSADLSPMSLRATITPELQQ